MEVRTILWPTDLSKNSIKAARHVASLALKYGAKIIVLYVGVDLLSYFRGLRRPQQEQLEHFQGWELKEAKKHLETMCEQELKACPNIEVKLVQGDAASEIFKDGQGSQGRHGGSDQPRPRPRGPGSEEHRFRQRGQKSDGQLPGAGPPGQPLYQMNRS